MRIVYPLTGHRIGDKCAALFLAWFYTATLRDVEFVLLDSHKIPANSIDLKRWFQYVPDPNRALNTSSRVIVERGTCEVREDEYHQNLFGNLWIRAPWAVAWLRRLKSGLALPHPGENISALAGAEFISPNEQALLRCSLIDYGLPRLLAPGSVDDKPKYDVGMHCLTTAEYNTGRNHSPRQFMELGNLLRPESIVYQVPGPGGRTADQILEEIAQCGSWIGGDTGFTHAFALMHPGRKLLAIYGPDDHCKEQFAHEALPIGFSRLRPETITWSSDPIRLYTDGNSKTVMENNRFDVEQASIAFNNQYVKRSPKREETHFLHSGDIGDIIAGLPAIKAAGGGRLFLTTSKETPKTGYDRLRMLLPLLRVQPYLKSVSLHRGEPIDIDFTTHRATGITYGNLCVNQAAWAGVEADRFTPWLWKTGGIFPSKRIVICRSGRHHGRMNWHQIVLHFKDKLVFMGLEEEWHRFVRHYGQVEFYQPKDFFDAAVFIANSKALISNQTSFWWLAEGMKHRRVLEKRMAAPDDSEIACRNAWHTFGPVNIDELEAFINA